MDYFDDKYEAYDIEEYLEVMGKEKLLTCINRLSQEDKTLIHLRFIHEMGFKHIGQLLGITEEAAKRRGQRILKKLRMYYEKEGVDGTLGYVRKEDLIGEFLISDGLPVSIRSEFNDNN